MQMHLSCLSVKPLGFVCILLCFWENFYRTVTKLVCSCAASELSFVSVSHPWMVFVSQCGSGSSNETD